MLNLVVGFVLGLVAYKFGVTLPALLAKVKSWFKKKESEVKVDVNVPAPVVAPTPSAAVDDSTKSA